MSTRYDWLIVGAGFTGAVVAERLAKELDQKVLVIDRRSHIAGNAYDFRDDAGNLTHLYGPHIFHTNSRKIFDHLSQFTQWRPYFHRVLAHIDGIYAPIPFNLNTIAAVFPAGMAGRLSDKLIDAFGYGARAPIMKLKGEGLDGELAFLADYIYDKVFLNYTTKQWGRSPEQLDPSVTARVPVVISRDDRYFNDTYQCMPQDGYTALFKRMLDHKNITVELNVDFADVPAASYDKMIYCGAIDEYFGRAHGPLPYRSLRFKFDTIKSSAGLATGTVNYPNEFTFTRMTDFSYLTGDDLPTTSLVTEYPQEFIAGENEPYYPIPSPETKELIKPYQAMVSDLRGKVWFAGRLADYTYYNMDQACGRGLSLFEKELVPAVTGTSA